MGDLSFKLTDNRIKIDEEVEEAISAALEAIGNQAVGHAKEAIRGSGAVDTGRLRNSMTFATNTVDGKGENTWGDSSKGTGTKAGSNAADSTNQSKPELHSVYIGTNVEYAAYVEMGSSANSAGARPFLKPAVQNHIEEYKAIFKQEMNDIGK